jgi:DNA-binding transcriptional LysR family regulator
VLIAISWSCCQLLLRVGFVLTTEGPALSQLIAAFQARYPGCEVRLHEVETFDAYQPLRRGDIDVLCNWLAVEQPDLTAGAAFAYYPRTLAVAPSHRLAAKTTVSVEELAEEHVALMLVEFLGQDWGAYLAETGKVVWVAL